ncbi:DUF1819 family protein [Luteimicrobium subarcticum]|uniref:Putative inner membrane protein DUF1819 n=1 Tax=Luteimicrobium subarcticum TaxID=620910 RepID=A0A2M8WRL0_9MICO|nr:DUF1819 family protein [Luteimicrobium subarcticum]PJI93571.1 putative inner membrane protein DUF1819 [Luteimicrobium subarcticum]
MSQGPDAAQRYRLSFSTGGLFLLGGPVAARLFLDLHDWAAVRGALNAGNLLQARTVSSATRWSRELVQRLEELSESEVNLLADAISDERAHLLWAAACRRYDLLGEFAEEVLRDRFLLLAPEIHAEDFEVFLRGKEPWHIELDDLTESTRRKLRTNTFLMMREAGFLTDSGAIVPTILSERLRMSFAANIPSDIRFFPTREAA